MPENHAAARAAIPASPSRFLIVGLRGGWRCPVHHETDVRFVDAHTERARGHDHVERVGYKTGQHGGAAFGFQAGVIAGAPKAGPANGGGESLGGSTGRRVYQGETAGG